MKTRRGPRHRGWAFAALRIGPALLILGSARASGAQEPHSNEYPPEPPAPAATTDDAPAWPRLARTTLEILGVMTPLALRYWLDDNPDGPQAKGPIAFDSDAMLTNGALHPLWGTLNYSIARANGLDVGTSFLFSLGSSALWEFAVEHDRVASVNDLVMTPLAGSVLGEATVRLGAFFGRSYCCRALAYVFWPERGLNDLVDRRKRPRAAVMDDLGLPRDSLHRFEIAVGAGPLFARDGTTGGVAGIRVETELLDIPEAARAGRASRELDPGSYSALTVRASAGPGGLNELGLLARVALAGRYTHDLAPGARDEPEGHRLLTGVGSAFEYATHAYGPDDVDQLSVLGLLGPMVDYSISSGGVRARVTFDAYGDFAAVRSSALDAYVRAHEQEIDHVRTYYYAAGATGRLRASVSTQGVEAGAGLLLDGFASLEDTFSVGDRLPRLHGRPTDVRSLQHAWLSYAPLGGHIQVARIEVERILRVSNLDGLQRRAGDTRLLIGFGAKF